MNMTVEELIEVLSQANPKALIYVDGGFAEYGTNEVQVEISDDMVSITEG